MDETEEARRKGGKAAEKNVIKIVKQERKEEETEGMKELEMGR